MNFKTGRRMRNKPHEQRNIEYELKQRGWLKNRAGEQKMGWQMENEVSYLKT